MAGDSSSKRQRVIAALEQHEGALMRYAARMLHDRDLAADVIQHAFLQLCSQPDDQFPEEPKPWLFRVCRNRILDILRQSTRSREVREASDALLSDSAPDPATLAERKDLGAWLHGLVDQLPPSQREVLVLWCQGLRYGQIAEITNQTEGGVRVKAHRGLTRLREHPAVRAVLATENSRPQRGSTTTDVNAHAVSGTWVSSKDRIQ